MLRAARVGAMFWSTPALPAWQIRTWVRPALATLRAIWPAYLLALVLILIGFTWSVPDHYVDQSFQIDETITVQNVNDLTFPRLSPWWLAWGTGLFYQVYVAKALVSLGGLFPLDYTAVLLVGRTVVLVSSLAAITLIYLLGTKLFDRWTGRLAAVFLAVLPGFVVNSHYLKTDIPMTCWAIAVLLAASHVMAGRRLFQVILLGALVGYTASIKYSGAVLFPAGLVAVFVGFRSNLRSAPWMSYVGSSLIGFAAGAPYALLKPGKLLEGIRYVASLNLVGPPYVAARPPALLDYLVNVLPYALTIPVLVATALSVIWVLLKGGRALLPIWTFLLVYAVLMASDNMRIVRYTTPLLPILALFLAYALRSVARQRWLRVPAILAACGLVLYGFVFSLSYVQTMAQTETRAAASQWIEQHVAAGPPIPSVYNHWLQSPRLAPIGFADLNVQYDIDKLATAESPYLILPDAPTRFYLEAIDHYPQQQAFLAYVQSHYQPVAEFENSQTLLGVDSRSGAHLPQDWLVPNPRITILERVDAPPGGRQ